MQVSTTQVNLPASPTISTHAIFHVFAKDWVYLRLVVIGVFCWFCLAQVFTFLILDTTTTLVNNSAQYLQFVVRNGQYYLFFIMGLILARLFKALLVSNKGQSAFPFIREQFLESFKKDKYQLLGIPLYFLIAALIFAVYLFSYSTIKTRIPNIIPYTWDPLFYKLDQIIFFGQDPWQYFAFLYDHPKIIRTMDFIYDFWAVILISCWFFSLRYNAPNKAKSFQFIIALLLTWFIGGNILAIILSSGGPVYYEAITGLPSSYPEQMARLASIHAQTPLRAFEYQELLWRIYEGPSVGFGGISAMPSMHCASSILLLLMCGKHKIMRPIMLVFCAVIFISSFVLAWHYAVDGLLAIPVVYGCWKLAGRITAKAFRAGSL